MALNNVQFVHNLGFTVFSDELDKIPLDSKLLLSTISPNSYGISTKDKFFKESLQNSDILVLDGVYFALNYFLKTGKSIVKNQGPDVGDFFLKKANDLKLKIFLLGSTDETLKLMTEKIYGKYPNICVDSYSPPFKPSFTSFDSELMIKKINSFQPNILFVGMTCPKQEKWTYQHKTRISANLICNIGAVFDWIAGNQKQIHPIWWKLRLAWLKRTIDRPEILKRYPNIGIYFKDMFLDLIGIKKVR